MSYNLGQSRVRLIFWFAWQELCNYRTWITAFFIGLAIHILQGNSPLQSIVPYFVPVFVQVMSKSSVKYKNRHKDYLVLLPEKRKDPAFIMARDGTILVSSGITRTLFDKWKIHSIDDFLGLESLIGIIATKGEELSEYYSEKLQTWYSVRSEELPGHREYLIWCENISSKKHLQKKMTAAREFSDTIIDSMESILRENTLLSRLAAQILREGYAGVFITRMKGKNLTGQAFRFSPGNSKLVEESDIIIIDKKSNAPVWSSRQGKKVIAHSRNRRETSEKFIDRWHFNKDVVDFLRIELHNFVNYHSGDLSIIAFNKKPAISSDDRQFMQTIVNNAHAITQLIDLAQVNEIRFLQSVTGLCAAAEYSDEITGKHILRVNAYSELLARELEQNEDFCRNIGQVASMHDIGKVAIPHIIKLNRKLNTEERLEMETHPVIGGLIIEKMMNDADEEDPRFRMAQNIAIHHHQHWDGGGYPAVFDETGSPKLLEFLDSCKSGELRSPKGEEIPLEARITGLADVYDALRSPRQYKPAFSHEKTLEILRQDDRSGKKGQNIFGPDLMKVLEKVHNRMAKTYEEMQG